MFLEASRLVTLTGAGGSGKSRLAVQVAAESLEDFKDGVWLVELAPLPDATLVAAAVALALGVREEPGRSLVDTLVDAISGRRLLIVLDNCEHLLDAIALLAELVLQSCLKLTILATSREPLGIDGEQLYQVPSLSLPHADKPITLDSALRYDAVQLFVDRAKAHLPTFRLEIRQPDPSYRYARNWTECHWRSS